MICKTLSQDMEQSIGLSGLTVILDDALTRLTAIFTALVQSIKTSI